MPRSIDLRGLLYPPLGGARMRAPRTGFREISRAVGYAPPWGIDDLVTGVGRILGVSISLSTWPPVSNHLGFTLTIQTSDVAILLYDETRSPRHQRQQVCHELAHLLLGHVGETPLPSAGTGWPTKSHGYSADNEGAAELLGTKLAVRTRGTPDSQIEMTAEQVRAWLSGMVRE